MIIQDNEKRLFTLQTRSTTYQIKADQNGVLLHTYYGPKLSGGDLSRLIRFADRGFSPNPNEAGNDRTYSLDTLPQEYSGSGAGDFRLPSLELELSDGSYVADLRYIDAKLQSGKYTLEAMPAFFGSAEDADTLIITLEDAAAHVRVELLYGVFEAYDLITRAARIVNCGDTPVRLHRAASLCLDFPSADLDFITFDGGHVKERGLNRTRLRPGVQSVGSIRGISSHQHNPFVMLCEPGADEEHGTCYGAALLYSGNFEAAVERCQFEDARLTMGIHPFHFCWTLEPGQTFTTPEAALLCSPSGFGEMSRQFHRAIRAHLLRDVWQDRRKPILVNSWEAFYFDYDHDRLLRFAREAAALGMELFVLDDGWFGHRNDDCSSLGDWWVNKEKLPGGLGALSKEINALGMEFGLWIEPEMVSEDSCLYQAHPDWVLNPAGRPYTRGRCQLVLDYTREEVREYIFQALQKLLDNANISYLKWDMNRALTQVWSVALPSGRQGEVYHRYVLGVYALLERVRQANPHTLIEGCSGGGGRFDMGMLYYTPQIWCSDNTDAIDRLSIQYGTSFAYPPATMGAHVSAVPNEQTGRSVPLETRGTVALSGTFGYEMDLGTLSEEEKTLVVRQIQAYKESYELIQTGDYYRLTPPSPDGAPTAWLHVSSDRRSALLSVVSGQVHAGPPFRRVKLRGLDPALRYRLTGDDTPWPGDVLMQAGYPLPMLGEYQSLRLWLKAE
ncbi:alpha-galactosidase [Intestinimonas massiliensis (ex Afouda et al. 2020)]|uniref:alpha-galactosidase n=1 Tax=Intestinimonas massiliensis (ex Afouda et al. 2020) TaxID=1673721 RepID=UPI0010310384|nr:alpha-galactosidase [Intestinimonas massiliensis (ex Afouda et al. 2020)]